MSWPFNAHRGLILVDAELDGPTGVATLRLALDTGANTTLINPVMLDGAGYDLSAAAVGGSITTANGIVAASRIPILRLRALGHERTGLTVLAHQLPAAAQYDGLLGLDFLRGSELTIDFRLGFVRLA